MKIAAAQIQSLKADIAGNIALHGRLIKLAASHQVELIVFPELSLTGYEPSIAKAVATTADDSRFLNLQQLSSALEITICVGVPTLSESGTVISMLIFQPGQAVRVNSKRYLHADEEAFFVPGFSQTLLTSPDGKITFAICYELSIPQHAEDAHSRGANTYIASVAKTHTGVSSAAQRLASIAQQYSMTVFMSNCIGECDNSIAAGQSAVWDAQGVLLASLNDTEQGLVVYDPASQERSAAIVRWIP